MDGHVQIDVFAEVLLALVDSEDELGL